MPSPRFKFVVALLSVATVATYVAEPYVAIHADERYSPAPDFELHTIDGSTFRLADHGGKAVLLDFMATWCPPCREEMAELKQVRASTPSDLLTIASIDIDYTETADQLDRFRLEYAGLDGSAESSGWFFALDTADEYVGPQYGANALPTLVLVDGEGLVRRTWVGVLTAAEIERALGDLGLPGEPGV